MMSHLDDGLIQELVDGEVSSRDLPPIQAHLASCAACTARLAEARELAGEADTMLGWLDEEIASTGAVAPAPDIAPQPRVATWPRNLAWAASLVLAVGLGAMFLGRTACRSAKSRTATPVNVIGSEGRPATKMVARAGVLPSSKRLA